MTQMEAGWFEMQTFWKLSILYIEANCAVSSLYCGEMEPKDEIPGLVIMATDTYFVYQLVILTVSHIWDV